MNTTTLRSALLAAALVVPLMAQAQGSDVGGGIPTQPDQTTHQVPEPGSLALAGLALAASLALRVRRARRSKQAPA